MTSAVRSIALEPDAQALAQEYDQAATPKVKQGQQLIELLQLSSGAKVLEIGAGIGRLAAYVANVVAPNGHVTAIDPNPLRVAHAAAAAPANLTAWTAEAEDLSDFPSETFDAIYMNSVFHWLHNKPRAIAEAFRVLKPGGRIALNSADPERPHQFTNLVRAAVNAQIEGLNWQWNETVGISATEMENALRTGGFKSIEITSEDFIDVYDSVQSMFALSQFSSYGNLTLPASPNSPLRAGIMADLEDRLETYRTEQGFRLQRFMIFAAARKPS